VKKKPLLSALAVILIGGLFLASAMRFGAVQAYTVDSISKPSVPEFTVKLADHSYDVPPHDVPPTYGIDQYTGKNVTIQEGYHVENKSIEITIKNQPFTPYNLTKYTVYYRDRDNFSRIQSSYTYDESKTVNFYYNIEVKGHFGEDWKSVESSSFTYEGRQSNVQYGSEYTIITVKADGYPADAVLDFRVQARIGYYYPYGPGVQVIGYDFYGQESAWSNTQTITIDTIPPNITLLSPQEGKFSTSDVPLDFAVDEPVSQAAYSLDGAGNVTVTGNTTLSGLSVGEHNLNVYAWDAAGNVGSSENLVFTITEQETITPLSIVLVAAAAGAVAVAVAGLLFYLRKRKR